MLRLPDGMRDRIKAAAEANNRSMNAEIVHALSSLYPEDPSRDPFLQGLMEYVASAPSPDEMKKRVTEANKKLYGTKFFKTFAIGVIDMPTLADGSLETCAALFEVKESDGPNRHDFMATLKWWISNHMVTAPTDDTP